MFRIPAKMIVKVGLSVALLLSIVTPVQSAIQTMVYWQKTDWTIYSSTTSHWPSIPPYIQPYTESWHDTWYDVDIDSNQIFEIWDDAIEHVVVSEDTSLLNVKQLTGTDYYINWVWDTNLAKYVAESTYSNPHPYPNLWEGTITRSHAIVPGVVPEPISSILFVTGGTLLAGRRLLRRKA